MALIDEQRLDKTLQLRSAGGLTQEVVLQEFAKRFWGWFASHQEDVVVDRKVLFFTLRVRVRDLRPIFVRIFGEEPAS